MKFGAFLSVCLSAAALADGEVVRRLSGFHFQDEAWNYIPVHDPATGVVDAIVAIAKPDATVGDNLNTVMFIRDGSEFEAWSWRNATRARAVYSAKMILNVSDDDDASWFLEEELPWLDENALRPPTPYMAGMLTDDPLFEPVVGSNDPQALLDMLASLGYPVTAHRPEGGGESTEPCAEQELMLLRMAGGTEWAITQTYSTPEELGVVTEGLAGWLPRCIFGGCDEGPDGKITESKIARSACTSKFVSGEVIRTTGGYIHRCRYEETQWYYQSRSMKWKRSNCSTVPCGQIRFGRVSATFVCDTFSESSTGSCPSQPTCAPASSVCDPDAGGAIAWDPWGPPC